MDEISMAIVGGIVAMTMSQIPKSQDVSPVFGRLIF